MPYARLTDRAVLTLTGADTVPFLQNLVTADVEHLGEGQAAYAALLTPQGKILFDFFLVATGGRVLLDCAATAADELVKRLGFYRLRSKVTIAREPGLEVAAAWGGRPDAAAGGIVFADPRAGALGWRIIAPAAALPQGAADAAGAYRAHRMALGIADAAEIGSAEFFPHEANLDQLHGVSFGKGCYVGQEVVSRMHHRGTARSRIVPVALEGPAPAAGAEIAADGRQAGRILATEEGHGLAFLRLDRAGEALDGGHPLSAGDTRVRPQQPPWARFDVPAA